MKAQQFKKTEVIASSVTMLIIIGLVYKGCSALWWGASVPAFQLNLKQNRVVVRSNTP